jgi:hypothetical protein
MSIAEPELPAYCHCVTCLRRIPRDEMHDKYECYDCRQAYLEQQQRRRLTKELSKKTEALGKAVSKISRALRDGKLEIKEPHVLYDALLNKFDGVEGFAKLYRERFDAACDEENGSHKVAADMLRGIMLMSIEARKTMPTPPNCNNMSDAELGEYAARLMQQKLMEMEAEERLKHQAEAGLLEVEPGNQELIPEDKPDAAELLLKASRPKEAR